MQIQGTNRIHSPQGINAPHFSTKTAGTQSTGPTGKADRVVTRVAALEASPRREEIARMLAGATITEEARAAAARLLEAAVR